MSGATPLLVLALVLGVLYVLMIRPQRRRQQDRQSLIRAAGVGDDILTNGGIYGTIIRTEGDDVEVEIAPGITVHMTRQGITAVLPPDDDDEGEDADGEAGGDAEDEGQEAPDAGDEEALRTRVVKGS